VLKDKALSILLHGSLTLRSAALYLRKKLKALSQASKSISKRYKRIKRYLVT